MKTYVLNLSQTFPEEHRRAGQPTDFKNKLIMALYFDKYCCVMEKPSNAPVKIHTIRANYELWRKRFEEIERGKACLSVRQWTGKPYRSKQKEIVRLAKVNGIGLQKLELKQYGTPENDANYEYIFIDGKLQNAQFATTLSENDGLTHNDWCGWFKNYDKTKPLAIIHFTEFRY